MRVTYSNHADKRMRERNVSRYDVRHVLTGRRFEPPSPKKRTVTGRALAGHRLEVVYTQARQAEFHIVTVKLPDR